MTLTLHRPTQRTGTPRAAALVEEGHAALERCLDEGLRRRIEDALSVASICNGGTRDLTEDEAAVVRRLYEQVTA